MRERPGGWLNEFAQRCVRVAASHAPETLSARLEEEWLGVLTEHRGALARVRFAAGCMRAVLVIAREHETADPERVGTPGGERRTFRRSAPDDFAFFTGFGITFVMIALLHVGLLWGIAISL